MSTVTQSAIKAIKSLIDPGMFGIFLICAGISFCTLFGLSYVTASLFNSHFFEDAAREVKWLIYIIEHLASVALTFALFPLVLPLIVGFFSGSIAGRIEKYEYPHLALPQNSNYMEEFWADFKFTLFALLLNILCIPFYLMPGINLILFYVLNGYLLGRQFFTMVAARYINRAEAEKLVFKHRSPLFFSGLIIIISATVPLLNLAAPFWGVAMMVHLYHRLYPDRVTLADLR